LKPAWRGSIWTPATSNVTNVEDALLDYNVEICPGCGWWCDSDELHDGEGCDGCIEREE